MSSRSTSADEPKATLDLNERTGTTAPDQRATWELPSVARERYVVEGVFARGGTGRILRAHDPHLDRTVALKELQAPGGSAELRFLTEARVTARLQHPSIVPIYEAGRWPNGEPYYAMKLVQGRSLAHLIAEAHTVEQRLALLPHVLDVAEAVAYAHSRRIIHRDIKPANVLVGEFGETVVIDWGLAKELGREEPPAPERPTHAPAVLAPELTAMGEVMGTPAYMAPEQAAGDRVDERADVYALGSLLYHVLTGQPPYRGRSHEVLQQLLTRDPPALERQQPRLPQELFTIVSRAMAREPAQRYPSARELAEDLRRFQTGQLVGSHRYSRWELLVRFTRRHRTALVVAAAALAVVVVQGGLALSHIIEERDQAQHARRQATQQADELALLQARTQVPNSPNEALAALNLLSSSFSRWGVARTLAAEAQARGLARSLRGHTGPIMQLVLSPDGRWGATTGVDRSVRLWDLQSGQGRVLGVHDKEAWFCAFSPDGRWLVSSGNDEKTRVWDLQGGPPRELPVPAAVGPLYFLGTQGQRLLTVGTKGDLRLWDLQSGESRLLGHHEQPMVYPSRDGRWALVMSAKDRKALWRWSLEDGSKSLLGTSTERIETLSIAPGGEVVATGTQRGQVQLWDTDSGAMRELATHAAPLTALAFSGDGQLLAAVDNRGTLKLLEWRSGRASPTLDALRDTGHQLTFSRDGRWLALGTRRGMVKVWEVASRQGRVLRREGAAVSSLGFSPDGKVLAVSGYDGLAQLLPVVTEYERVHTLPGGPMEVLRVSAEGRRLLARGSGGLLRLWDMQRRASVALQGYTGPVTWADFAAQAEVVAVAEGETVRLWNGEGQLLRLLRGGNRAVTGVALSTDGAWVAAGDKEGGVWLWETASGQGRLLGRHHQKVEHLLFSAEGQRLLATSEGNELRLWSVPQGQHQVLHQHQGVVSVVAFSPDGRYVVSGSQDRTLWLQAVNAGTGRHLDPGGSFVQAVAFSADGRLLAQSGFMENGVRLWDVETGRARGVLPGADDSPLQLAFSPEARRLAAVSATGRVWLWDVESGERRLLGQQQGRPVWIGFSPEGHEVLAVGLDGTLQVWPDDLPLEPEPLRAWLRQTASL